MMFRKWDSFSRGMVKKRKFFLGMLFIFLITNTYAVKVLKNFKYSECLYNISLEYKKKGKNGNAKKFAKRAIFYNPENAKAYDLLGYLELDSGNLDQAVKYFYDAVSQDILLYDAFYEIGKDFLRKGDYDAALRYFDQGKKSSIKSLKPFSPIYFSIAKIYERRKDFEKAFNNYFTGMEFNDNNVTIIDECVKLMKKIENKQKYLKRIEILRRDREFENADLLETIINRSKSSN